MRSRYSGRSCLLRTNGNGFYQKVFTLQAPGYRSGGLLLAGRDRSVYFPGVADATGHGVPGAFVSIVCANALNKAVLEEGLESPAEILWRVREVVVSKITQAGEKVKDGMDIALIRFEKPDQNRGDFAGANRPLWVMSAQGLSEMAGTRQPIGYVDEPKPFEDVELSLGSQAPAMVYAFTDGIVDQMGGPQGAQAFAKGHTRVVIEPAG